MPINTIKIKRSKNTTLESPSSVVLESGELFYMKPIDATSGSGKLYVGDGTSNMSALKDIGYSDRQAITTNSSDIADVKGKIGNWESSTPITSTIQRDESRISANASNIASHDTAISNLCNLITDSNKGIYFPTSDGRLPSLSNTSINIGNVFLAMNDGVNKDFDWDDNISLDNPGEWKSGNKDAQLLHNSKVYGLDARVGKIFDTKFGEKGIFGKDFVIYKTVGGTKQKVLEFIRSDNNNDIARIGGGEVTYGEFEGQNKALLQSVNIKGSTLSGSYISNSTLRGTITADGATISGRGERVNIVNPNIDNPTFSDGFINKYAYFARGIVNTDAIKDASVTASKLAAGALIPSKIQGKTGTTSVLYSDTRGNVYWGDAPNTSGMAQIGGSYNNYLAYIDGKTVKGKIQFSGSKTSRFLNEGGTWESMSASYASYSTAGMVKPSASDFIVGASNGGLALKRSGQVASTFAILTEYQSSLEAQGVGHYYGQILNDGKTLVFKKSFASSSTN